MSSTYQGANGCEYIGDTNARTGKMYSHFIVNTTAVVSAMTGIYHGTASTNLLTTMGLSGASLAVGTKITLPIGSHITAITLASGSIIAYN
jgi:hypothetical protein